MEQQISATLKFVRFGRATESHVVQDSHPSRSLLSRVATMSRGDILHSITNCFAGCGSISAILIILVRTPATRAGRTAAAECRIADKNAQRSFNVAASIQEMRSAQ